MAALQSYIALFMALIMYPCYGSKCPHDLFNDLKGWYHETIPKLQTGDLEAAKRLAQGTPKKAAAQLNCVTIMKRKGVSSKPDIVDGADEGCNQLPNGRIYGNVDLTSLKLGSSRVLVGIKIVSLEHKSEADGNNLIGTALLFPDKRKINFNFVKKDSGIIQEVGLKLGIKRSMLDTMFNNPTAPVCIIRTEDTTETTPCTIFTSYTEMICQSSALENCDSGAASFEKGCTCKKGFKGLLCTEKENEEIPWYQNKTILEYIGLGVAGLFLLGSILFVYCRRKRRRGRSSSVYSQYSTAARSTAYSESRGGGTSRSRAPPSTAQPSTRKTRGSTAADDSDMGATLKQFPTIVPGTKLVINKSKK